MRGAGLPSLPSPRQHPARTDLRDAPRHRSTGIARLHRTGTGSLRRFTNRPGEAPPAHAHRVGQPVPCRSGAPHPESQRVPSRLYARSVRRHRSRDEQEAASVRAVPHARGQGHWWAREFAPPRHHAGDPTGAQSPRHRIPPRCTNRAHQSSASRGRLARAVRRAAECGCWSATGLGRDHGRGRVLWLDPLCGFPQVGTGRRVGSRQCPRLSIAELGSSRAFQAVGVHLGEDFTTPTLEAAAPSVRLGRADLI